MAYLHLNPQPYVASVHCGCGFNCIYTIIFYFIKSWVVNKKIRQLADFYFCFISISACLLAVKF